MFDFVLPLAEPFLLMAFGVIFFILATGLLRVARRHKAEIQKD
jgi:hypothetical protein